VQINALALRMRPRTPMEAADLGVRLCQSTARQVYVCYWAVGLPIAALCLATYEIAGWLPGLLMWWAKPWLDRTILFVLSRAAFGQTTSVSDLWSAQRRVWWSQLLLSLTLRRLSPWRSFTQPVHQLEGLPLLKMRKRVLQVRGGQTRPAVLMTSAFSVAETILAVACVSLIFWFMPSREQPVNPLSPETAAFIELPLTFAYFVVVLFLEPFYVAAGFAMYLNRRTQLEAWDIEQEFRRAFPA
jgi:hypothetical protein